MRHVVVQGGTDGIGRELVLSHLRRGDRVLALGRAEAKGADLAGRAGELGAGDRFSFLAADLSAIGENLRVIETIRSEFERVDVLVLCARHYSSARRESVDGIELTFALFYLSRFLLCHGLAGLMRNAGTAVVVNVAGPGGRPEWLSWDDLALTRDYEGQRALLQCGVANDLLGLALAEQYGPAGIQHVLVNPGMVSTGFSGDYDPATAAQVERMKRMGMPVAQAVEPLLAIIDSPPGEHLSAFSAGTPMDADSLPAMDRDAAARLAELSRRMIEDSHPGGWAVVGEPPDHGLRGS